jgi:uncharacterized protein YciI
MLRTPCSPSKYHLIQRPRLCRPYRAGMFIVELEFSADPCRLEARPAHRRLLQQLHAEGRLVIAGPWEDDSGAALVFDTDSEGLERIMAEDPYFSTPGVRVAKVRAWRPIVGGHQSSGKQGH